MRNRLAQLLQAEIVEQENPAYLATHNEFALEARYPQVYRQQGVRYAAQLMRPPIHRFQEMTEMDYMTLHYYVPRKGDDVIYGIPEEHPYIANRKQRQGVFHITDYHKIDGLYKKRIVRKNLMVKAYHRQHKHLFWIRDPIKFQKFQLKRPWNLIVNYGLIDFGIEFRPNPMRQIFRFNSQYQTYLNGIKEQLSKSKSRHQIMFVHLPDELPPMTKFRMAAKEFKRTFYPIFPDFEHMQILDLWKWMDNNHRKDSLLHKYISDRDYDYVDLFFHYKGSIVMLNLGLLDRWVTGKEKVDNKDEIELNELDDNIEDEIEMNSSTSYKFQKRIYLFMSKIIAEVNKMNQPDIAKDIEEKTSAQVETIYNSNSDDSIKDEEFIDPETIPDDAPIDFGDGTTAVVSNNPAENLKKEEEKEEVKVVSTANAVHMPDNDISALDREIIQRTAGIPVTQESKPDNLSGLIDNQARKHVDSISEVLMLSEGEKTYWNTQVEQYHKLPSPFTKGESLSDYINKVEDKDIQPSDTRVPDMPLVTDETMLNSAVKTFHRDYIRHHLQRDVVKSIASIQRTGILVTDYKVSEEKDVASHYEVHSIQFTPVGGSPSTVHIRLPKIQEDGTFRKSLVTYRIRNQRRDKPIRKVSDMKASLTSYYGKLFVTKCERRKFNQPLWVRRKIDELIHDEVYTNVKYGKTDVHVAHLPDYLKAMTDYLTSFTFKAPDGKPVTIDFSQLEEQNNKIYLGDKSIYFDIKSSKIVIRNMPYDIGNLLHFNVYQMPPTFAEVKILGEMMPVGFVLGRYMGFSNLVQELGLQPIKYEAGKHIERDDRYLVLRFQDEKWLFDRTTMSERNKLIIAGFLNYEKDLKQYSVYDFDHPDTYGAILQQSGVAIRYERELDLIKDMFVDPMTHELLVKMNEPTEIESLLIRCTELLSQTHQVDEINMDDMLIKGYERVPGAVYAALVSQLRVFKGKSITYKRKFDMKPDDALLLIANDPTTEIADEINPLHNTKEKANITFVGEGGRSRRSMVAKTRMYHDTDLGVISEANVDSLDIGVTTYLSANPTIQDRMGETKSLKPEEANSSNIYSVTQMLNPFGEHDDEPVYAKLHLIASSINSPNCGNVHKNPLTTTSC